MNLEELVEDADNDDGDPSNQYEARSEEPNENRESNNEADVGVFNEDRASSLSLGRNRVIVTTSERLREISIRV